MASSTDNSPLKEGGDSFIFLIEVANIGRGSNAPPKISPIAKIKILKRGMLRIAEDRCSINHYRKIKPHSQSTVSGCQELGSTRKVLVFRGSRSPEEIEGNLSMRKTRSFTAEFKRQVVKGLLSGTTGPAQL